MPSGDGCGFTPRLRSIRAGALVGLGRSARGRWVPRSCPWTRDPDRGAGLGVPVGSYGDVVELAGPAGPLTLTKTVTRASMPDQVERTVTCVTGPPQGSRQATVGTTAADRHLSPGPRLDEPDSPAARPPRSTRMPGFQTLPADSMTWTQNVLGAEVTRLYTNGAVLTVVRGHKGDLVPAHGYTHGSVTYVVSGRLDIDGHVLTAGDGGSYRPGRRLLRGALPGGLGVRRRADGRRRAHGARHRRAGGGPPRRLRRPPRIARQRIQYRNAICDAVELAGEDGGLVDASRGRRSSTRSSTPAAGWPGPAVRPAAEVPAAHPPPAGRRLAGGAARSCATWTPSTYRCMPAGPSVAAAMCQAPSLSPVPELMTMSPPL